MSGVDRDEIAVFSFSLDPCGELRAMRAILDSGERARESRFVDRVHRTRFVVAHAFTRGILARLLRVPQSDLQFASGPYGKPAVAAPASELRFNLSHAGHRAMLAVAHGREVGVDIETEHAVDVLELARMCFSHRERGALERMPEACRLGAFVRGWTRKESFVKALGSGLSFPLALFDVSLDDSPADNLLLREVNGSGDWTVRSLDAPVGCAAALTAQGSGWHVVQREISWAGLHTAKW